MSQLSRLIEQARKTRRVNDMFKIGPAVATSQEEEPRLDILLVRLADLERSLFDNPALPVLPVEDFVNELQAIAREL